MNSFILLPNSLVAVTGGKQYSVDSTHPNYAVIIAAIKAGEWDKVPGMIDVGKFINDNGQNKITVQNGVVMYGNDQVRGVLVDRLLGMLTEGFDVDPMVALLANLMANPAKTAIDEFYLFIESGKMPITEDGCVIAYKRVDDNYFDCYTHEVVNKPYDLMTKEERQLGKWVAGSVTTEVVNGVTVVSMPREKVDPNRHNECSVGLHFCSLSYLCEFNNNTGRILLVKINPKDIVSIPQDYNNTKGRCWKYEIIGSLVTNENNNITEEAYTVPVVPAAAVVTNEHLGYNDGYKDGRNKDPDLSPLITQSDYAKGYAVGYKDGRGKQKRKFPAIKAD